MTTKKIRWFEHARENLVSREIDEREVLQTIHKPDYTMMSTGKRRILMRFYHDEILQQEMLLRIIIEETDEELIIVTLYKTSRSERYIKELK